VTVRADEFTLGEFGMELVGFTRPSK